jgi:hypothetical protein
MELPGASKANFDKLLQREIGSLCYINYLQGGTQFKLSTVYGKVDAVAKSHKRIEIHQKRHRYARRQLDDFIPS